MRQRAGRHPRLPLPPGVPRPGGFSLFEMLVALAVLMVVLGAIVFNFTNLARGAELDEGVQRMSTALALARAHAAHTQRPVRMTFEADEDDAFTEPVFRVRFVERPLTDDDLDGEGPGLFGESSDNNSPGTATGDGLPAGFRPIPSLAGPQRQLNRVIAVTQVRPLGGGGEAEDDGLERELTAVPPAVEFYPDGSSESAEVVIASRDILDERRVAVRIVGMTGRITSTVLDEDGEPVEDDDEPEDEGRVDDDWDPGYLIER